MNDDDDDDRRGRALLRAARSNDETRHRAVAPPPHRPDGDRKRRRRRPSRQSIPPTRTRPPEWFADDRASIRIEPYYCRKPPSCTTKNATTHPRNDESDERIRSAAVKNNKNLCHWLWERQLVPARRPRPRDYDYDYRPAQQQRCSRILPFTTLGTSATTAVLGLDRTGSYLIALTGAASMNSSTSTTSSPPSLRLQLLAVPSPAAQQQQQQQRKLPTTTSTAAAAAIPIGTWPLEYPAGEPSHTSGEQQPCPVTTAVRVWLTPRIGICVYRDATTTTQPRRRRLAHAIVFPITTTTGPTLASLLYSRSEPKKPHHGSLLLTDNDDNNKEQGITGEAAFWRLYNIPSQTLLFDQDCNNNNPSSSQDCDLLCHVDFVPAAHDYYQQGIAHGGGWCDSVVVGPAWLFFLQVDDGYRLTWITDAGWHAAEQPRQAVERLWTTTAAETAPTSRMPWVVRSSHGAPPIVAPVTRADSGWEPCRSMAPPRHRLPCTALVSVAALLHNIRTRRPGLVPPARHDTHPGALPEYAYQFVGLSDGGRRVELVIVVAAEGQGGGSVGVCVELDCFTCDYRELEFLRHTGGELPRLCAQLARRRRQCRHHSNNNKTLCSRLDCETFDNRAVRRQTPVGSMKARDAPVELVYG